jgi:hypothetical protein
MRAKIEKEFQPGGIEATPEEREHDSIMRGLRYALAMDPNSD